MLWVIASLRPRSMPQLNSVRAPKRPILNGVKPPQIRR